MAHSFWANVFSCSLFMTLWIELVSSSITIKNKALPYLFQTFLSLWCWVWLWGCQRIQANNVSLWDISRAPQWDPVLLIILKGKGDGDERQTPDKSDCLDYLSVSDVRSALWATMASWITASEIRAPEKEKEGAKREDRKRAREGDWRVENRDVTRLEESSVITASQQPVWSWGMAEGCKAFEADNPFVMITHVFQCARWSSLSYCIMGSRRQLPLGPAWLWAAVGIVGSAANLLQYL